MKITKVGEKNQERKNIFLLKDYGLDKHKVEDSHAVVPCPLSSFLKFTTHLLKVNSLLQQSGREMKQRWHILCLQGQHTMVFVGIAGKTILFSIVILQPWKKRLSAFILLLSQLDDLFSAPEVHMSDVSCFLLFWWKFLLLHQKSLQYYKMCTNVGLASHVSHAIRKNSFRSGLKESYRVLVECISVNMRQIARRRWFSLVQNSSIIILYSNSQLQPLTKFCVLGYFVVHS